MASILVVDDQALVRNLFERVLKAEGHQVTLCENGQQGYDAGATGWITKPVPAEKILKLAEAVLPK